MAFYTIDFTVTTDVVSPDTPQFAGHTGDHRAVLLRFAVPFEECRYRLEIVDGCGGYDITAPLDVVDGMVSYEIPSAWTAAGVATVRLIAVTESEDGTQAVRFHFAPVYLNFDDREEGEPTGQSARPAWQETLDEAHFFLEAVEQKLRNGELNGKDGEKGDKGDKGDAGYTPQKGVDYYTDAEREGLIAELGARDVDQLLDEYSPKAIANKTVTTELNRLQRDLIERTNDNAARIGRVEDHLTFYIDTTVFQLGNDVYFARNRLDKVENQIGEIETALDGILAIQESLIGGESV